MGRCCRWSRLWGWLVREGDTKEEAWIKTMGFPYVLFFFLFSTFNLNATLQTSNQMMYVIGGSLNAFGCALFLAGCLLNAPVGHLLDVLLGMLTVGLCANDLGSATIQYSFRAWAYVVLVLDAALLSKRDRMPRFIISFVLVYMTALSVESFQRYGLYEAGYWGTQGMEISYCNCPSPPCSDSLAGAFTIFLGVCTVFLGDFYFTSGFASGMTLQLRRVEASILVAGEVASALARYDVDVAETAITSGDDLPPELVDSFLQLLCNLRSYKAYLPHSCLVAEDAPFEPIAQGWRPAGDAVLHSPSADESAACLSKGRSQGSVTESLRSPSNSSSSSERVLLRRKSKPVNLRSAPRRARVSLAVGNTVGYLEQHDT
eukprot:Hpha_TRINITY_DN15908_c8_g3::TRINITY_DN15908_c8_g3_i1::g.71481::m.71481